MTRLDVADLTADHVKWWELAGHDSAALTEAWRRVQYACRAVAEIGMAFGDPADESIRWFDGPQMLDGFFAGPVVGSNKRVMAALRVWDMHLFVITESGEAIGELDLEGHTLEQATGWIVDSVLNILDEPVRQATEPAGGLPEHALGTGGAFAPPNQFPQAELIRLCANANSILRAAAAQFDDVVAVAARPGRFDITASATLTGGSIDLGLAPPDEVSAHGYWYVAGSPGDRPKLSFGCWHDDSARAVFDLVELHGVEDVGEQRHRVGTFLCEAFNACGDRLVNG